MQVLLANDDAAEPATLRFLADSRKAAALRGPHVARILHVGVTEDGHPFIVREPSSGQTLGALLAREPSLSTEHAVDIAIAVSRALHSAHAVGLVHGALDATMVTLSYGEEGPSDVRLQALGTTRALAMLPADGSAPRSAAEIDPREDVWAVGVLLYTILAGAPPFTDTDSEPALLAGVPDGLAEIVDACLSRDPALRPPTAESLAARLSLHGSKPVFDKASSLLVVDTGKYEALVLEQLVKEAAPSAPLFDVELELELEDVIEDEPIQQTVPITVPMTMQAKVPAPVRSVAPPVSITVPPPKPLMQTLAHPAAKASGRWQMPALGVAACLLIAAAAVGFGGRGASTPTTSSPPAPVAAAETLPAAKSDPLPLPAQQVEAPPPVAEPRALAISDLPTAPATAAAAPAPSPVAVAPSAKPHAAGPAPRAAAAPAPAADAPPAADPIVRSASAPLQPQPKASDDDLRRFLDDRR